VTTPATAPDAGVDAEPALELTLAPATAAEAAGRLVLVRRLIRDGSLLAL